MIRVRVTLPVVLMVVMADAIYIRTSSSDVMKCSYGERGSLTATCVNATSSYFKSTSYRFDHLDETLRCLNCSLQTIDSGTFDISGNQIKNLDLTACQINTVRQRAFVGLIFMETLTMANNEIKSIYPGTFTGVKKVKVIDLRTNSISVLSEDGFLELINLEELNLRNNEIQTIADTAFNGLQRLRIVDLGNNKIAKIETVFNNLTSLQVLNLDHNRLASVGSDFVNLTSLRAIDLSFNSIQRVEGGSLVNLTALRSLDLSNNSLEVLASDSLARLRLLETLNLSHNKLVEIPQRLLQNLHGLRELNVSNNNLSTFQTGVFSGLPELRSLNLSHNAISEVEVTGVFSLTSLHTLDLSSNNITDFDYELLITRLPAIAYIDLVDNWLPCDMEKDMEHYFALDNIKFVLFRNTEGAVKCVDTPPRKFPLREGQVYNYLQQSRAGNSANPWIFTLICITLLLVAILYFLIYRTYRELRYLSIVGTTASSRLHLLPESENVSSTVSQSGRDLLRE